MPPTSLTAESADIARCHATASGLATAEAVIDAELVRRFKSGDERVFEEIVARHREKIYHLVFSCLRDRCDTEEVVDDAFVRAYRGLPKFRGDSSLATWLHHIAVNRARSRYRQNLRHRRFVAALDARVEVGTEATLADFVPSDSVDPAEELDRRDFAATVAECVERLPNRERAILALRGEVERSYENIAIAMGIKIGTVRSRLARARGHLRTAVHAMGPAIPPRAATYF